MSPASPKHSNFHSNFGQPSPWESARRMCLLFPCLRLPRLLPRDFLRFVRLAFYAFNICHIFLLYVFPAAPSLLSHFASFALPVFHFSFPAIIISYFLVIPSFAGRWWSEALNLFDDWIIIFCRNGRDLGGNVMIKVSWWEREIHNLDEFMMDWSWLKIDGRLRDLQLEGNRLGRLGSERGHDRWD